MTMIWTSTLWVKMSFMVCRMRSVVLVTCRTAVPSRSSSSCRESTADITTVRSCSCLAISRYLGTTVHSIVFRAVENTIISTRLGHHCAQHRLQGCGKHMMISTRLGHHHAQHRLQGCGKHMIPTRLGHHHSIVFSAVENMWWYLQDLGTTMHSIVFSAVENMWWYLQDLGTTVYSIIFSAAENVITYIHKIWTPLFRERRADRQTDRQRERERERERERGGRGERKSEQERGKRGN